jgi:uncharacterized membrane protein (DUF4010 family)
VVVAVLAFKEATHAWIEALSWEEIRSALAILAATLIALPLLPDRALDPYGAFNPREVWLLTIVIAGVGFGGYVALRVFGPKAGLPLGAAIGALVSSTIVTLDLARRAKAEEIMPFHAAAAAAIANAIMFARVGVLIGVFAAPALAAAASTLIAVIGVSLLAAGGLAYLAGRQTPAAAVARVTSPLDFAEVARFATILAAITAAARLITHFYGGDSLVAFAAAAGLVDVDAVALAVGGLVRGELAPLSGAQAILLAAGLNTLSKVAIAAFAGGARFAAPYAAASALALGAGAGAFFLFG